MESQSQETPVSAEHSLFTTPSKGLKVQDIKIEYFQQSGQKTYREPNEKQLCEILLMIKERLPDCRVDRVLTRLYDQLLRQDQSNRRRMSKLFQQDDDYYLSDDQNIAELEKTRMQQEYARKFQNSDANPRFYQQREIAKLFCHKGYGYPTAREYLGENITPNRYNNVITTIVRLSYRKLEYFIIKNLNSRLRMISREQLKMIKTPLVNCKNWMTERQADNFHRFVKLTYKIPTDDPERQIAQELHTAIMNSLKDRNVTYKHHRRGQESAGWTSQMEQTFILHYLKTSNFTELQKQMMLQHPAYRSSVEIPKLKQKLDRLIHESVKKLNKDRMKFGMNQFPQINEYFTRKVIQSNVGEDLRRRLLSYHLDHDINAKKVRWVFQAVKEFQQLRKEEVEEIEDSSCEVVPKQELKAEDVNGAAKQQVGKQGKKEQQ